MGQIRLDAACGAILGNETARCREFLGVPYARAARFAYAVPVTRWEGTLDATAFGPGCPQNRAVHEHQENPTRRFYKREYREGQVYRYDEDCLNLNLYTPKAAESCPVVLFFHGGGFDSGLNCESPFDGSALAERGILTVFANYRVGPLGHLTHGDIRRETGRDGNFGLDDQRTALLWVRAHIRDYGGDPDNITLMGQSAGAISVQLLCLDPKNAGLFRRAFMMSGAGRFPKFAQPRRAEDTHSYWLDFLRLAGCGNLAELRALPLERVFDAVERIRAERKDNTYNTMPVVDGALLPAPIDELIGTPLPVDTIVGYTARDMYAPLMAWIGNRYAKKHGAWVYCFERPAPGDDNGAFHSVDLRYVFGTLDRSWRPYAARDREISAQLMDYLANFARRGDPNGPGLPRWEKAGKGARAAVLRIRTRGTKMGRTPYGKLLLGFLRRPEPKA